jgi:hypothetical protein
MNTTKLTFRGKTFIINLDEIECSNVVYKITTDRGGIYIGHTEGSILERCSTHLINCEKEKRRIHQSICKECKVEILYQCNGNSTQHLKYIENYTIYKEICKVLDNKNVPYEGSADIFDFAEYFNDVILNQRFDVKRRELQYFINCPTELHLERYTPIRKTLRNVG